MLQQKYQSMAYLERKHTMALRWLKRLHPLYKGKVNPSDWASGNFIETKIDLDESMNDMPRVAMQVSIPDTMIFVFAQTATSKTTVIGVWLLTMASLVVGLKNNVVPQEQGSRMNMNMRWF